MYTWYEDEVVPLGGLLETRFVKFHHLSQCKKPKQGNTVVFPS